MKKYLSRRKKKKLLAALLTGLCLMTPWNRAEAVTSYTTPNGLIRLDYYSGLPDWMMERIYFAADYWDGVLKHTTTARQPAVFNVVSDDTYNNAKAICCYYGVMEDGKPVFFTRPNGVLNYGMTSTAEGEPASVLTIGTLMYPTDAPPDRYDTPLPQNSRIALAPTIIHEIGHAMGLICGTDRSIPAFYNDNYLFDSHLYDWRGVQAQPGMEIQTVNHRAASAEYFDLPGYKQEDETTRLPYFSGEHVQEVLQGAKLCNYDVVGFKRNQSVPGLPIQGNETNRGVGDAIDLSHIELRNSLLSHQTWRNYVSPMEAELALFQDLGYTIDRRDFFGRSVYGDGLTIVNDSPYYDRNADGTAYVAGAYNENPYGMGLHIYGNENTVFQNAPLMTKGMGAVGIRVDGYGNNVTVNNAVNVQADGLNGNGILVAYGKDHNITLAQGSRVTAAGEGGIGAAFDFGQNMGGNNLAARASYAARHLDTPLNAVLFDVKGPLVTDFTVQGELAGQKAAIAISDNAYVKNIRIGTGAKISGDIVSRWVYDDDKITQVIDGTRMHDPAMFRQCKRGTDLTTRLAFEGTGLSYDGNITGVENMRLFVSGDLVYGGTAQVLSATVEKGGSLFGGTYHLVPDGAVHNESPALGYSFPYMFESMQELKNVGLFTNHGTIGAASKDATMKIFGDLLSDGTLQAYAGGAGGYIDVSGKADINGSDVTVANWNEALPGESIKVVKAESITGDTKKPVGTSYAVSGMMSATNTIEDNMLSVVTKTENNLGDLDATQSETFGAMVAMDNSLKANGDSRRSQMRSLFSLSPAAAKDALSAISSNASAQSMAVAQRSMMTHHILSSRLNEAFMPKPVKVKLPEASLMDENENNEASTATQHGLQQNVTEQSEVEQNAENDTALQRQNGNAEDGLNVSLNLLEPAENDIWLKFGKNWGDVKSGADYHSSTTMLGYDKTIAPNWRVGAFAGYSSTGFADNTANNELKDTRFGFYAGYNKAGKEAMAYLDYGWLRNKLHRSIPGLGLTANARYHSRILELGGEYLYDLHAAKNVPWHVRPYVNAQLSRLWQNSYSEEGAGVFNQVVQSKHNDYFGMGAGVEFKRYLPGGNYSIRAGVRHAFAGAEPKLRYSYMGNQANTYDMRNVQDKTHFVLSIGGETQIAKGWSIGGDAGFTRGRHDKDFSCSVTVKRMW